MNFFKPYFYFLFFSFGLFFNSCASIDDERIPNFPVNISISDAGMWNIYGVSGFGSNKNFILSLNLPSGFPYSSKSATGFGGVLLIEGIDPFSANTSIPLAYDLACPVERKADIRVKVSEETFAAICPECHSAYDVTMQRGAPISGPAATGKYKYALKSYSCVPSGLGGFYISN